MKHKEVRDLSKLSICSREDNLQIKFDEIDERADLFALGQILYWIITKTDFTWTRKNQSEKDLIHNILNMKDLIYNSWQNEREKGSVVFNEIIFF